MIKKYFSSNNANDLYLQSIKEVSENPEYVVSPRGQKVKINLVKI